MRIPGFFQHERPAPRTPPVAPRHQVVPPEVNMARAFVMMTGVDPTSVFAHQSPPVRQKPPAYGSAPSVAQPRRRKAVVVATRAWRSVRQNLSQAARWASGLWAQAKRRLAAQ